MIMFVIFPAAKFPLGNTFVPFPGALRKSKVSSRQIAIKKDQSQLELYSHHFRHKVDGASTSFF